MKQQSARFQRTRIKFCGMTRPADAEAAVELGVDALGFVLVPQSKRAITPEKAALIRRKLPAFVSVVALVMDADADSIQRAIDALQPDLIQFHGSEPPDFCSSFGLPYIKAVAMGGKHAALGTLARRYARASALLLDSHASGMGGTGKTFDWSVVGACSKQIVLAGGLRPDNVAPAIHQLRPYAVDVSSGIELKPGQKDLPKMRAFVEAVRRADLSVK